MHLPDFTAEASLGRSGESYASVSSWTGRADTGSVTPQLFIGCTPCSPNGWQNCCSITAFGYHCQLRQCTFTDPCALCTKGSRCSRAQCYCECQGGVAEPDSNAPCGFRCT